MLSVTILPVIYAIILNMDLGSFYKVIFPILFSLVPLVMFVVVSHQTTKEVRFFRQYILFRYIHFLLRY